MSQLDNMKNMFDDLEILYSERNDLFDHIYLFLHYTGVEFYFDKNGKYLYLEEEAI